jgi:hypothetical protein
MLVRYQLALLPALMLLLTGCGSSDSSNTSTKASRDTRAIAGDWTGELSQQGLPSFRIAVAIAPTGGAAVAYTGIDCAGVWTELGGSAPATYEFREDIKFGSGGKCKGSGRVSLKRTGTDLAYTFHGGGVTSHGSLSRTSQRELKKVFRQAGAFTLPAS